MQMLEKKKIIKINQLKISLKKLKKSKIHAKRKMNKIIEIIARINES